MARNRLEQISILDVLFLYVENAMLQDMQSDQITINGLREIARVAKIPSPKVTNATIIITSYQKFYVVYQN